MFEIIIKFQNPFQNKNKIINMYSFSLTPLTKYDIFKILYFRREKN